MYRIVSVILILLLSLPCVLAEMPAPSDGGIAMILGEITGGYYSDVELFYETGSGRELTAVTRRIYVPEGGSLVESALSELFRPTEGPEIISPMPGDASIKSIEYGCGMVTVDLSINLAGLQTESELMSMMLAISNTLTGISGVEYVNILVNSRQESLCSLPTGVFSASEQSVATAWAQYQAEYAGFNESGMPLTRRAALYYPSSNGQWLLPDVMELTFDDDNFAEKLIYQLANSVQDDAAYSKFMSGGINVLSEPPVISVDSSGLRILDIKLSNTLRDYMVLQGIAEWQLAGAVTLTMCSFIPEIDAVRITLGEDMLEQLNIKGIHHEYENGLLFRDDFDMYSGSVSRLYFANENGTLSSISRSVSSERALSAYTLMTQLISGPSSTNTGLLPVMPAGVTANDILGVAINSGTATLNMTADFYRLCQLMSEEEERLLVYSIVNTLCTLPDVSAVKIIIEGEQIETLSGSIYLMSELLPNPGIVE